MQLAELKSGLALTGLEPNLVCTLIAVLPYAANAVQVIYRLPDGGVTERLLVTADEPSIENRRSSVPGPSMAMPPPSNSPARQSG